MIIGLRKISNSYNTLDRRLNVEDTSVQLITFTDHGFEIYTANGWWYDIIHTILNFNQLEC